VTCSAINPHRSETSCRRLIERKEGFVWCTGLGDRLQVAEVLAEVGVAKIQLHHSLSREKVVIVQATA